MRQVFLHLIFVLLVLTSMFLLIVAKTKKADMSKDELAARIRSGKSSAGRNKNVPSTSETPTSSESTPHSDIQPPSPLASVPPV